MTTSRDLRDHIAGKLSEYGRLRRWLLVIAAFGAASSWILGAVPWGETSTGEDATPVWVDAARVLGLLVSGGVAAFFAIFEDNSADLARTAQTLEDERDAARSDSSAREEKLLEELAQKGRELTAIEQEYMYALELYQFSRGIGESSDPMLRANQAERAQMLPNTAKALLEFIVEAKGDLLDIAEERWTFGIYVWNAETQKLEMLACRRWSKIEEDRDHRTWARSEGHVGLAFNQKREQVCGDTRDPSVNGLITARGEKWREYDDELYVSFASVPIQLGADAEPLGVIVATSNKLGRFLPEAQARQEGRRDTVEALRTMADILATLLVLQQLK